jgi:hypothetical protein
MKNGVNSSVESNDQKKSDYFAMSMPDWFIDLEQKDKINIVKGLRANMTGSTLKKEEVHQLICG